MKKLLLILALLTPSLSFGQTLLLPGVLQQFTDESGVPIAGGFVCTTISGTGTNLATYPTAADALANTNPNANPVVMDAAGRVTVWLKPSSTYRIIVYKAGTGNTCNGTAVGTAVRTMDAVSANPVTYPITAAQGGTGLPTYAIGDMIYASATTPTLARLADVAVNHPLLSGGANTAPAYAAYSIAAPSTSGKVMTSDGTNWTSVDPFSVTRFGIITATRDLSAVTGAVAYTGCGFAPKAIDAFAAVSNTVTGMWGFAINDGTAKAGTIYNYGATAGNFGAGLSGAPGSLMFLAVTSSAYQVGAVTAWGADGFTITYTKVSTPTGTADITFRCIR